MNTSSSIQDFAEDIILYCNGAFSPMYRRVFEQKWDNAEFSRMRRPYFHSDSPAGFYEVYIPTFEDPEGFNMNYYRIAVQVLPELDEETAQIEATKLRRLRVRPAGRLDSELLTLIAPRRTKEARDANQFLRGKNTYPSVRGYFTARIISSSPKECFNRLLKIVSRFLENRLKALLENLNITVEDTHYYIRYTPIIEKISKSLANGYACLVESWRWLRGQLGGLQASEVKRGAINEVYRKIADLKPLLNIIKRSRCYELPVKSLRDPPIITQLVEVLCNGQSYYPKKEERVHYSTEGKKEPFMPRV